MSIFRISNKDSTHSFMYRHISTCSGCIVSNGVPHFLRLSSTADPHITLCLREELSNINFMGSESHMLVLKVQWLSCVSQTTCRSRTVCIAFKYITAAGSYSVQDIVSFSNQTDLIRLLWLQSHDTPGLTFTTHQCFVWYLYSYAI